MRLKNILIVVEDLEASKQFYKELFGLQVVTDLGEKVILTEGLVLHEKKSWEALLGETLKCGNMAELYFEERNMDVFLQRLEDWKNRQGFQREKNGSENREMSEISVSMPKALQSPDRRVVQIKDPDGHLIEVAEIAGM